MVGCVGESAACAHFGELVVVAHEQHASTGCDLSGDGVFEDADVGHARFVDHEQGAVAEPVVARVPATDEGLQGA